MYRSIVEAVLAHAGEIPDKIAIGFKGQDISYGELGIMVRSMASILSDEFGIRSRDRVMLSAVSKPDYVVTLLALQYLGAITVPVDKTALEENIVDVYLFNSASMIFTDTLIHREELVVHSLKGLYERVYRLVSSGKASCEEQAAYPACYEADSGEVAEMLFTTGTTGRPKGTMLSYGNLYASTHNTWEGVGMLASDVVLIPLPLNHSVGMRVLRTVLYIGATMVIENGFAFPKQLTLAMDQYKCSGFVCVPAVLERLYRQMGNEFVPVYGRLRYMEIGAGSLSFDMKNKLSALLPDTTIINTWGSTETGGAIFLNVSRYPDKRMSLGRPVGGIKLKVVDPEGREITARSLETAGRMALQGPMMMLGYYHLEEATRDALRDGWLFTNDLVYTDDDGFVYMLGRADDIINVGGEKVSPIEVENLASEHPELYECACIGVEDPEGILGQVPVLFYVPEAGKNPSEKEMVSFFATRMEAYKLPRHFVRVTELPRNRMKKLDRKKLREYWSSNGKEVLVNPVIDALLSRQSIRDFSDQRIKRQVLETLLKCAVSAPSGNNMQTWRFYVIDDPEKISRLKTCMEAAIAGMEGKKVRFYGFKKPACVVLISNDRRNDNGLADCACAAENLMLAAHSLGIGSVWNNALKSLNSVESVRELLTEFGVSIKHDVYVAVCLGYPEGNKPDKPQRRLDVINWVSSDYKEGD